MLFPLLLHHVGIVLGASQRDGGGAGTTSTQRREEVHQGDIQSILSLTITHVFCLVFIGYRASVAEIPFCGGVSHLHLHALQGGSRDTGPLRRTHTYTHTHASGSRMSLLPLETILYILYSEKIKSCKKRGYITEINSHRAPREKL